MTAAMMQTITQTMALMMRRNEMQMYKIELVQVRKMTVYCSADDRDGAEKWFEKNRKRIFRHLNTEDIQAEYTDDVYCFTIYTFSEDSSCEHLCDLLQGRQVKNEEQTEAVYKVLKQETKEDSDNGASN